MKKLLAFILICVICLPVCSLSANENTDGFKTFGAKYSSNTYQIIYDKETKKVKDEAFSFAYTDKGALRAEIPDYDTMTGIGGSAVMSSENKESLDGLTVVVYPDKFDFNPDENGVGNQISLLWTELTIDMIADPVNGKGAMMYTDLYTSGLKNIMPEGGKGLCITLGNTNEENNEENTKTASDLSVVYYDGSEFKSWDFTREHEDNDDIMPLILDSYEEDIYNRYTGEYVDIDITYGLVISIRSDNELGYVVNVNGVDYAMESDPIDLKGLKAVNKGYITVGAVSNSDKFRTEVVSFELAYINTMTAKEWASGDHEAVIPCLHDYEKISVKAPECETEGIYLYKCTLCGDRYNETVPALGHAPGEWEITKEASEKTDGERVKKCIVCDKVLEREVITAVTPPPGYFPLNDVPEDAWYYESVKYCFEKGYIIGNDHGEFLPDFNLTREQFVVILARVMGADLTEYTESNFSDVEAASWYGPSVIWAYENGYVKGVGNGVFGTGEAMTRESVAVMLYRYAKDENAYADMLGSYRDGNNVSSWAKTEVNWAVNKGILGSTSTSSAILSPKMTLTRAQAVKIFMSFDMIR